MAKVLKIIIQPLSEKDKKVISEKIVPHTPTSAKQAQRDARKAQRQLGLQTDSKKRGN